MLYEINQSIKDAIEYANKDYKVDTYEDIVPI